MNEPVKILMICTVDYNRNGITTCILNWSKDLIHARYEVEILAANGILGTLKKETEDQGCRVISLARRNRNLLCYFFQLMKLIKKNRYSIVHVHGNSCTMGIELVAARLAGCPIRIAHSHNTECSHRKAHIIMRTLFEWGCNSRLACGEEAGQWLFGGKKFDIIKNGINAECYQYNAGVRKCVRNSLEIDADEIVLGHVGIFNEQKNHSFLIEIFNECLKIKKNIRLMLIGEGEQKDNIYEKAVQLGIENKIVFIGVTNKVEQYLSAMDHFVFPSLYEGFGIALLEAQCSGLSCTISSEMTQDAVILNTTKSISLTKTHQIHNLLLILVLYNQKFSTFILK